jgi:phosphoribosylformylglycinamidine synthase
MGMDVDVRAVPRREPAMESFEVMTSESQERMLAIVEPAALDDVMAVCARWEVRATVVGRVTDTGRLRILDGPDGEVLADVPAASLHDAAPANDRPRTAPVRPQGDPDDLPPPADLGAHLLSSLADTTWVSRQYDHMLFLNTVAGPGASAAVLRLRHPITGADTGRGMALTTDGNHRWCAVDPRAGTAMVVMEAVANLACVGARPLALVNCLNFGNPEHPEVMWQLAESVDGMAEACTALGVPVIGGNVSLYNESRGVDIDPTPIVGLLGMVDPLDRRPPPPALVEGMRLLLLGHPAHSLAGSRWAFARDARGGRLDPLDLVAFGTVAALVRELVRDGLVAGLQDVADGGLGLALAEMAARSSVGCRVAGLTARDTLVEAPGRFVLCCSPAVARTVERRATDAGVPVRLLGASGTDRFVIEDQVDLPVADLVAKWQQNLPQAFGKATTH